MALDAAATFDLRSLIAKSQRQQELYLATIADAVLLAAEQVQDKRLDLLEQGAEVSASGLLIDFLFSLAFSFGSNLMKDGLANIITKVIRQRRLSAFRRGRKIIFGKTTYDDIVAASGITRIRELPKSLEFAGTDYQLFREFAKETLGLGLEKTKEKLKEAATKGTTVARPDQETGGDTPGVGLMDVVLSFVHQQQAAIDLSHDILDFQVTGGQLDDKTSQELLKFLDSSLETQKSASGFGDLSELKEQMKLFFEASIWATLGGARLWKDWEYDWFGRKVEAHIPAKKRLLEYWLARFGDMAKEMGTEPVPKWVPNQIRGVPVDPNEYRRRQQLRSLFRTVDEALSKVSDPVIQLIRRPVPKST